MTNDQRPFLSRPAALLIALLLFRADPLAAQQLVIRFFDVGQGDAALIVSPEGKTALIDAGPDAWQMLAELRRLHIDTLDLVVASHNHADHIGGLPEILDSLVVRNYLDNELRTTTSIYLAVHAAVRGKRIRQLADSARTLQLGSVSLRILPTDPEATTQNNSSVGVLLTYGAFTALFTGDAEDPARDYWREHAALPHVTVLKVAHHGAFNGTDSTWESVTRPCYGIISFGDNSYGHPAVETIQTLAEGGAGVYLTKLNGTVEVNVTAGGSVTINSAKAAAAPFADLATGATRAGCPAVVH